jgi:hypothetical protein
MSTYKRVNGDYTIITLNTSDVVTLESTNVNIIGNLTVTGNASLTGNIAADKIFNGTTSIEIQTINGNANITVGGTSNVAVWAPTGEYVTGLISATGNITGANINTAGQASATGNVTGGNVITGGNIVINQTSGVTTQSILQFRDANTSVTSVGANIGSIEWYTSDAAPGARVTAAIRAVYSDAAGNANILIQTANTVASTRIAIIGATGNVGIANVAPNDTFAVSGTIWGSSTVSAVGNITGGNINTVGVVSATANIQGGNLRTAGLVSATGNIDGGNIISSGALSAGAAGIVAVGNITGGNLVSQGIITSTGNVTATDYFGTTVSVSGNITGGNAIITTGISATNVTVSGLLSGAGIGAPNFATLSADAPISSATPANIGTLTFTAVANNRYNFEAYIDLVPDGSMTVAPAVNFSAGTCNYTTETQTTATSAWSVATKTTSDDVTTTYSMTGATPRTLRISGTYFHTATTAVTMRLQNSTGTITAKAGSFLRYTRVA